MTRLLPLAALLIVAVTEPAYAQKAVILIRHAERGDGDYLTEEGRTRAKALVKVLKDAGVKTIVRSNTERTRETSEPIATHLGIEPIVVEYDGEHVPKAFEAIQAADDEAVVLYVGHSDTLGPLLDKLGYDGNVPLGDDPFGNMIFVIPGDPEPTVVRLHYSGKE